MYDIFRSLHVLITIVACSILLLVTTASPTKPNISKIDYNSDKYLARKFKPRKIRSLQTSKHTIVTDSKLPSSFFTHNYRNYSTTNERNEIFKSNSHHKMNRPLTKEQPHPVKFGLVEGEDRGDKEKLITPAKEINDDFFWIRNDDRKNQTVLDYLKTENEYTQSVMADTENLQKKLYDEHISLLKEDVDGPALPHGDKGWDSEYYYFSRRVKGKSYPIHMRINKSTNEEETLLDENALADGKPSFDLGSFEISKDHKTMSYGVDIVGHEKYKIYIIDIETKQEIEHKIPEILYCEFEFWKGNVYYTQADKANRVHQLWKYDTKSQESKLLFQDDDELNSVHFYISNDRNYLFVSASSFDTSNLLYISKDDPESKVVPVTERVDKLKYSVTSHEGTFFMKTNKDDSKNFKVMKTDPKNCFDKSNWEEFIPYDKNVFIQGVSVVKNHLILSTTRNGDSFMKVIPYNREADSKNSYDTENAWEIEISDPIKNVGYYGLGIYDLSTIVYYHDSLNKPLTYYKYNLETKTSSLYYSKEVPNYDQTLYETTRSYGTSKDGTKVPVSIIYRKDKMKQDGSNPLYLYGYGSYGHTVDPGFVATVIPLLDRGFVYAIAHVRGGSFLGYEWYEGGKMHTKMNTFLDFIAIAEHMVEEKYTSVGKIAIEGRSAGGLLVGAAMTMRPDLFTSVIGGVPFVDVMNTMSDPSIPLTTPEWEQWGNPNIQEDFDYMVQYCPYFNIKKDVVYPNLLALGGLHDPRVQYWEPVKFVAKLRQQGAGDNLMLVKIEMEEGHFSAMDRYKKLRERAYQQAFMVKTLGLELV